ncbi:MAG TPA: ABC transporter ATP-binding protein [Acetobacteraceae bacterium]|nr:ABC transporter ATP-binding protein [Acetobacteraceae bacterium]
MARITLDGIAHAYGPKPSSAADYALQKLDVVWRQGLAYALLGPSGCGKTTLLNIISGLVRPSEGRLLFDAHDVTDWPTERRNIAQVFQFPVIYDTMTVGGNLAFPLRNRGVRGAELNARVGQTASMLGLADVLDRPARDLSADAKQKISLGRGLVRSDVAAVLFDEPLTVIDPGLKWELRSRLKAVHRALDLLMIYVTHDQTEARVDGHILKLAAPYAPPRGRVELGVRPDFVQLAGPGQEGLPVAVDRIDDLGRVRLARVRLGPHKLVATAPPDAAIEGGTARLLIDPARVHVYADDVRVRPL